MLSELGNRTSRGNKVNKKFKTWQEKQQHKEKDWITRLSLKVIVFNVLQVFYKQKQKHKPKHFDDSRKTSIRTISNRRSANCHCNVNEIRLDSQSASISCYAFLQPPDIKLFWPSITKQNKFNKKKQAITQKSAPRFT